MDDKTFQRRAYNKNNNNKTNFKNCEDIFFITNTKTTFSCALWNVKIFLYYYLSKKKILKQSLPFKTEYNHYNVIQSTVLFE